MPVFHGNGMPSFLFAIFVVAVSFFFLSSAQEGEWAPAACLAGRHQAATSQKAKGSQAGGGKVQGRHKVGKVVSVNWNEGWQEGAGEGRQKGIRVNGEEGSGGGGRVGNGGEFGEGIVVQAEMVGRKEGKGGQCRHSVGKNEGPQLRG